MGGNTVGYYLVPPVWIGTQPQDSWNPSPDEIRSLNDEVYRAVLSSGISVKVTRGGLFAFDFSNWPPGRTFPENEEHDFDELAELVLRRTTLCNAHIACFHQSLSRRQNFCHDKMIVSPSDLIFLQSLDKGSIGFGGNMLLAFLASSTYPSTYPESMKGSRIYGRNLLVQVETIDESFQLLETILSHADSQILALTELYLRSCKAYEDHNYSLSLITAWAITEQMLQIVWERHVEENREKSTEGSPYIFINADRKKKLTESRDFTASVVSEILSLVELLPFSLYQDLCTARQARNDWIHKLKPVDRATAEASIRVAEKMLSLAEDIDFHLLLT